MYSDLSCDYINPIDLCEKLNPYLLPEIGLHSFVALTMLLSGNWFSLILNLPILVWNFDKVFKKRIRLDATEIFRTVSRHQKESFVKLGMYLMLFLWYLYQMITTLIADGA